MNSYHVLYLARSKAAVIKVPISFMLQSFHWKGDRYDGVSNLREIIGVYIGPGSRTKCFFVHIVVAIFSQLLLLEKCSDGYLGFCILVK